MRLRLKWNYLTGSVPILVNFDGTLTSNIIEYIVFKLAFQMVPCCCTCLCSFARRMQLLLVFLQLALQEALGVGLSIHQRQRNTLAGKQQGHLKCWPLEISSILEPHDPLPLRTGIVTVGVLTQDWALR